MDAHDLYGLPLDRFVAERTGLARELRRAGRRKEAEAVAALRKPSLAAWAVNQLVRTQSRAMARLFEAGDAVQAAQADLLSGHGDGGALREALTEEREAVGGLVEVAGGLLSSEGQELSPAMLERVADTLHAAALDGESRSEVSEGCLERELRHVGLGGMTGVAPPAGRQRKPAQVKDVSALRKAQEAARRTAERAARDLQAARAQRDAAAQRLAAAQDALAAAEQRATEADAAYELARRKLESA